MGAFFLKSTDNNGRLLNASADDEALIGPRTAKMAGRGEVHIPVEGLLPVVKGLVRDVAVGVVDIPVVDDAVLAVASHAIDNGRLVVEKVDGNVERLGRVLGDDAIERNGVKHRFLRKLLDGLAVAANDNVLAAVHAGKHQLLVARTPLDHVRSRAVGRTLLNNRVADLQLGNRRLELEARVLDAILLVVKLGAMVLAGARIAAPSRAEGGEGFGVASADVKNGKSKHFGS